MKWFEVWQGNSGRWLIYEVTEYGQHYECVKSFKTKKGAENWAKKQWYRVTWR